LIKAADAVHNNNATHHLVKAFRQHRAMSFVEVMSAEREKYFSIIRKRPPLPDCVFEKKICLNWTKDDSDVETIEVIDLDSDEENNECEIVEL
jgi:hypothetical protein